MQKIFILPIKIYRLFISSIFPPCCRFIPSCSEYAVDAIKTYGIFKGSFLVFRRILKCHPFYKFSCPEDRLDPVPIKN